MRVGAQDGETLWTIQPLSVWQQLERDGRVEVDRDRAGYGGEGLWQYDWLAAQLARRLPRYRCRDYPWWAYCYKPDLRTFRHSTTGSQVCIELQPAAGTWTRFPTWMWDTVYSGRYLAVSFEEFAEWTLSLRRAVPDEDAWPLPEPWRTRIEVSWERLFDRRLHESCWLREVDPDDPRLDFYCPMGIGGVCEGVVDALRMADVVDVRRFTGKNS